ncbi:hypothetical protein ACGF07_35430 [Kitasatospora sp. NPDC048194]|uniref:hypothetical protein n=1 Tax=Kitasatospora sp. NPDC048194 TaxID=3364045 RepID=UPI003720419D
MSERYEQRIIGYRSHPGQIHGDCYGQVCVVTEKELIIPGARRERTPLTTVGAVHHERDRFIVVDAGNFFSIECHSEEARNKLALAIAWQAGCNLFTGAGPADKTALVKKYFG